MAVTPDTDLRLISVPIEIDNKIEIKYNDKTTPLLDSNLFFPIISGIYEYFSVLNIAEKQPIINRLKYIKNILPKNKNIANAGYKKSS